MMWKVGLLSSLDNTYFQVGKLSFCFDLKYTGKNAELKSLKLK